MSLYLKLTSYVEHGGYFADGTRLNINGNIGYRFQPYASLSVSANYNHITFESDLLRLQEPLTRCKEKRFQGPPAPNMASNHVDSDSSSDEDESKYASVSKKQSKAGCREADDELAAARSSRLFMNPTRYDRTTVRR